MSAVATSSEGLTEAGTSNVSLTWLASCCWLAVGRGSEFPEHMGLSTGLLVCLHNVVSMTMVWVSYARDQSGTCSVIHHQERLEPWKSCTSAAFYWPHQASPDSRGRRQRVRHQKSVPGLAHCALFLDPQLCQAVLSHFNSPCVECWVGMFQQLLLAPQGR